MGILGGTSKLKKNRRYNYRPQFYEDKGKVNPYKLEHKFDHFRTTVERQGNVKVRFGRAMDDLKRKGDRNLKLRMSIIVSILVLVFLYIIDFDLSIFFN